MAWHLMMVLTDVRDGDWGDIQYTAGEGYALLDDAQYALWQRHGAQGIRQVQARLQSGSGGWRRPASMRSFKLDTLHRTARTLKEAQQGDQLPVDDIDRFYGWYWALPETSVAYFEKHLRREPATERALAGLQALLSEIEAEDEVRLAASAIMFVAAPGVVPGPLGDEVLAVLRGWRDEDAALSQCKPWPETTRSAAAFVQMAFAGFPPLTKCPTWVRSTLKATEMEGLGAGMREARKAARRPPDDRSWMQWG